MKSMALVRVAILGVAFGVVAAPSIQAQTTVGEDTLYISERNLSGPRLGVTLVPGDGELYNELKSHGAGRTVSQFGWHFEHRVRFQHRGPAFVIEFVPLVGAVEYGKLIPSASLMFGIRFPEGFEFGMGPNLLFGGSKGANTALVLALGKTFDYSGVSIPVNIAFVTSPIGNRIGFIFGYAL